MAMRTMTTLLAVHATTALRPSHLLHRRALLHRGMAAAAATLPISCHAVIFVLTPAARITSYPPLEYLEPIYELKLSLDALASVSRDPQRWPALRKRLDRFFSGGPVSEKFYYAGLSIQYADNIAYVRSALRRREIQADLSTQLAFHRTISTTSFELTSHSERRPWTTLYSLSLNAVLRSRLEHPMRRPSLLRLLQLRALSVAG